VYFGTQYNMAHSNTGYDNFVCRIIMLVCLKANMYGGWNFNSGNYLFTTDTQ